MRGRARPPKASDREAGLLPSSEPEPERPGVEGAKSGTWRAVVIPYVVSRLLVGASLVVTRHVMSELAVAPGRRLQASLLGWDAGWYRDIANGGYNAVPREGLRFFPLFPLVGRVVSWVPGMSAAAAVVIVANAFALALGFALHALVMHERDDFALARRACWLVYLVPPAFVLVMGYAEAMFMTGVALVLLTVRSRRWWWAAWIGFLMGLTRPVGILLAVPALVETIWTRDRRGVAAVAGPVAGFLAYLWWAQSRTHEFLYPVRVQEESSRRGGYVDPFRAIGHAARETFSGHLSGGIHAVSAVILIGLLAVLFRRWPSSFALYASAALLVALSSRNLDSLERYGLATIPFVLAGADVIGDDTVERTVLVLAGAGLVLATVLAFCGVMVP